MLAKCHSLLRYLSQKAGTKERVIARRCTPASSSPCPTLLTSNLTRPRSPLTTHGSASFLFFFFFLSSSLNYWKQNGLRTKTQADVGWLIMARFDWRPCQMKNGLEKLLSRKIRGTCYPFILSIPFLFCTCPFHICIFFSCFSYCSGISPRSYQITDIYIPKPTINFISFFGFSASLISATKGVHKAFSIKVALRFFLILELKIGFVLKFKTIFKYN